MKKHCLQNIGTLGLCLLLVIAGIGAFQKKSAPASARTDSRKLPIYCVQTDSPKVAVSFDAAWGNVRLREKTAGLSKPAAFSENLIYEYLPDLQIWNYKTIFIPVPLFSLRKIPRCKEHTPDMFHIFVQVPVCQFLMDSLTYLLSVNQPLDFLSCFPGRLLNKSPDDIISACITPECLWLFVSIRTKFRTIVDHVPWTIYIRISKMITIIPPLQSKPCHPLSPALSQLFFSY